MMYGLMGLFAAAVVLLDQITKALTVANIPLHGEMSVLPGFFHFTYVQNTGAAFSSFQGMRWLFLLIFAVFTGLIVYELVRKTLKFSAFEWWCIAAIYGGGVGNMLDRVRLGFVVDMIEVEFIRFPVFNVADCFITCGCIAMIVSLIFFNKEFWKEEKK